MDFIKHINEAFEGIEYINNDVLSERVIEDQISSLEKNLVDTIHNYASAPIVIERMGKTIEELEATDLSGMSEQSKSELVGMIKHHKVQQSQNIASQERSKEDIAYYQSLITNWRKVLEKFTK